MSVNAAKAWTDGELFHGDDLDRLFINSTMRFPSAANRATTLVGDFAPVAGTHTALQDDHLTYKYTGTLWLPPVGTAMFDYCLASVVQYGYNGSTAAVTGFNINQLGRNWGNWFNPTNGRFTPQLAGFYELSGGVAWVQTTETNGLRQAMFRLNGVTILSSLCAYTTAGRGGITVSADCKPTVAYFNGSTDFAELAALQNSGYTLNISYSSNDWSRFAATYQGA